jgi:chromosome segregation ATPase
MEGKAIGMLAAFALIACFAGGLSYFLEIDSKRHDLAEAQTLLNNVRSSLETKRAGVDSSRSKLQSLREQIESHTTLTDAKQSLAAQIATLEIQEADLLKEFVNAVQKVRASSAGLQWADVTLGSGQVLTGVTIQKVSDTDVSLTHSGGVSKIPVAELPADLKERFRYNMVPMVQSQDKAGAKGTATGGRTPVAAPTPSEVQSAKQAEMQTLANKITTLQNQVFSLEKTRDDWADKASQHRALGMSAQGRGRPSSVHFANASAADQQAAAVNQQINAVHNEINALQSKIH